MLKLIKVVGSLFTHAGKDFNLPSEIYLTSPKKYEYTIKDLHSLIIKEIVRLGVRGSIYPVIEDSGILTDSGYKKGSIKLTLIKIKPEVYVSKSGINPMRVTFYLTYKASCENKTV